MASSFYSIDFDKHPNLQFRIDHFNVPAAARAQFDEATQRNMAFIQTLPGFQWHLVFEKTSGPSAFNVTTIAVWDSPEAMANAIADVRAYYERIQFDPREFCERLGIAADIGHYHVPDAHALRSS